MSAVPQGQRTRTERLCDHLWRSQRLEFAYNRHDCGLFVTRWVDEELGTDYTRRVEVARRRMGIARVVAAIRSSPDAYLKIVAEFTPAAPREGLGWEPGDVALFAQEDGTRTLGLLSRRLLHAPGPTGLVSMDAVPRLVCHWGLECLS